jgi:hemerythrin-like metal-binding protein
MQAPFIIWTPQLSVGVAVLDEEHKKMVELINDLHSGITAGRGTETLGIVLDQLVESYREHFTREEELFAQTTYPAAEEHIQEHHALTQFLLDVQDRYNHGKFDALSLETLNFFRSWMSEHLQGTDKKYTEHLNAHGIF